MRIFLKPAFFSIALIFCLAIPAYAIDVTLQWDANTESNLAGYKVYYRAGSSGGGILANYSGTGANEGDSPIDMPLALDENPDSDIVQFTVTGLTDGQTYYFVVTAYNDNVPPLESGPSNEEHTIATPSDTTPPYATNRSPAPGATGVAIDTLVALELRDAGVGVDHSTITMRVNGSPATPSISGTQAAYTVSYNPPADFNYDQTVSVEVDASDLNGNVMATDSFSFTTGPPPDTAPPVISNVQVTSITETTAVISWTTNEPSDSEVQYDSASRLWGGYPWGENYTSLVTSHSVTLTGLNANTTYYFRVGSTDGSGNGPTTSNEMSFTTEAAPTPTPPSSPKRLRIIRR